MIRHRSLQYIVLIVFSVSANDGYSNTSHSDGDESLNCAELDGCMKLARTELFLLYDPQASGHSSVRRRCQKFSTVDNCMKSVTMSHNCSATDSYRHWLRIRSALHCVCQSRSKECMSAERCVYTELRSVWAARCIDLYYFNLLQKTRSPCHFVVENHLCQLALVNSACHNEKLTLSFADSLLSMRTEAMTSSCQHDVHNGNIDGYTAEFRYSERCPRTVVADVDQCSTKHLTYRHVLRFHDDNQLVAIGNEQSVDAACRAVRQFKRCISAVKSSCRRGVQILLDYQPDLHKYLLRMNVICRRRVLPIYKSSSECYREMISEHRLDDCNSLWARLAESLSNVSAYQFYCQPNDTKRHQLIARINSVKSCHKHHFYRYCGTEAADVMDDLLQRALRDPVFLRYRYRPNCASHTTTTTPQTTFNFTADPVTSERPLVVDSTTEDELTNLTFAVNLTSLTLDADIRQWRTGVQSAADHGSVTLNVLIVTSLVSVLMRTIINNY